ncbi:aldo/keto reductase [Anaerotignum sp.]|nr:aldo/keto reductase [Anaerotignum sp.]MBQ7758124.1 aldo/keto reductase [Anaerotignum sp.]
MIDKKGFVLENGEELPFVGFGTYLVKEEKIILDALEAGYRHIDTARRYENEKMIGNALKECGIPRRELFLTSKVWKTELGYDKTMRSFEASINDLGVQYLDMFLIHWPMPHPGADWKPLVTESWKALEKLYEEGAVSAIGVCNFLPQHLLHVMKDANTIPMVDQLEFHPGYTQHATTQFCLNHGIQVEAWSPLGRGKLLDDPLILELSKKYGKSPAQICLRFCLQNNILPLPKSSASERMKANLDIFDFDLELEDVYRLMTMPQTGWSGIHPEHFD